MIVASQCGHQWCSIVRWMMFSVFDEGNTGSNVVVIESIDLGHGTSVRTVCSISPPSPREPVVVSIYRERVNPQARQG